MTERRFGRLTDPPVSFVLVGARIVDPAGGTDRIGDLAVVDGRITDAPPSSTERIEAAGWTIAPGFCDLHTHLREPGTDGETVASGARAAARGGFTTVCAMPNTDPPLDARDRVAAVLRTARGVACRVRVIGAATVGRAGERAADVAELLAAGAIAVSDDGSAVPDDVARAVLAAAGAAGVPLIEHAEDAGAPDPAVMRAGSTATRLGLPGWPPDAELRTVERDIRLAEATGARLHLTHLSTARSVEAVRAAKGRGVPVTCDVTPHHLALTDGWVAGHRRFAWEDAEPMGTGTMAYDASTRVNPPLSSHEDALALLDAVDDGTVDAIATDHAPHPPHRKLVPFAEAAPGLVGLETALSLGLAAVDAGRLRLERLLHALSVAPARIIGETRSLAVGEPADLVAFDPAAGWRVEAASLASASGNTPLLGTTLPGVVRLTVADGRITYRA